MKKLLAIWLSMVVALTSCAKSESPTPLPQQEILGAGSEHETVSAVKLHFSTLDDQKLLRYMEDTIYTQLVRELDSEDYFVEHVEAIYISKEYLEELAYNSQENNFFGYTWSQLEAQFQGNRFVFTLGPDGQTAVRKLEEYDDTLDQAIKNVAIGTGVILICVTVSAVTGGTAPAVSMIFAASAKEAAVLALSSGVISGVSAGVVEGFRTRDFDKALKAAAVSGSEGYKWGAVSGAIAGGAREAMALKGASLNGLTMNQAARIQRESGYPLDVIKQFHSVEEYQIYKDAGLAAQMVDGKLALVQDIDLNYMSTYGGKQVTNLERMRLGGAPCDPVSGNPYELHHIGQKSDATLAVLTRSEHRGNAAILNRIGKESEIEREVFNKTREEFWKSLADSVG